MFYHIDSFFFRLNKEKKKVFYIWSRRSTIFSIFLNKNVFVYNGKKFEKLLISEDMIGFKFGDFIFTKKRGINIHKRLKTKKKKKK